MPAAWDTLPLARRVRYRLEFAGLWLVSRLVPLLPFALVRRLAAGLGSLVFLADGHGRRVALANLDAVFGSGKSPAEKRRIARASYAQFARTMLELFWARNLTAENYTRYCRMEGWEQARDLNRRHHGGIFVCLHYGNFEWLSLAGAYERLPGCIVTQEFKNPLLGPVFDRLRASSGHRIIQRKGAMLATLKHLKAGGNIGVLIDLNVHPRQPSVVIDSCGLRCLVTKLHAILQKRTGHPVIPIESVPLPDGTYRTIAHDPLHFPEDASEQQIAQACWDFFEPRVRRQPEAWLWAYKHWRYRPTVESPGSSYPFYSNPHGCLDESAQP